MSLLHSKSRSSGGPVDVGRGRPLLRAFSWRSEARIISRSLRLSVHACEREQLLYFHVCLRIYIYIYNIYICQCMCVSVSNYYTSMCACAYVYIYTYIYIYIHLSVHVCEREQLLYFHVCLRIYKHIYVCLRVYIYIYIYI
jgi:hypothetical protein